ncbi:DUF3293 domain-containing protein [Photobacterium sp. OFAV2-7]|uniref:DUF3293 domain-containing protein n=1 Tax=Photobacterium sp. OFAV2-7 TaxID=2917748 RepID=UPI001EF4C314|nr:DUF3293 domain-containing protein [Photobacterium sp. OFAV2-7]MCG7587729.1 DUF3293 domain-containing protein [Photobacterium sp. OFAV2-7]
MCENISLWCSYQAILFKAEQHPVYPRFAILTAFNPRSIVLNNPDNLKRNELLKIELLSMTNGVQRVTTSAPDGSWQEIGFAADITVAEARQLACRWQQNAFYWVELGELRLVPALMTDVAITKLGEIKDFFYTE